MSFFPLYLFYSAKLVFICRLSVPLITPLSSLPLFSLFAAFYADSFGIVAQSFTFLFLCHCLLLLWHFNMLLFQCISAHLHVFFSTFPRSLSVSLSVSLSISSCLPFPNLYCDRANPLIIHKLLRLSWQWRQIPTGFNHGSTNEISMANAHGSPSLLTALPPSQQALHVAGGYPGCLGRLQGC